MAPGLYGKVGKGAGAVKMYDATVSWCANCKAAAPPVFRFCDFSGLLRREWFLWYCRRVIY